MSTISKATVISIEGHGSDIREYALMLDKNHYFEAGSFLLLTLEQKTDYSRWPSESRCFSIASQHNEQGIIRLIIRKVGCYTSRIFEELAVGATCTVKYAFGDFLLPFFDPQPTICCIAAGTGVAPILGFCEQLKREKRNQKLHVFYSFKNETEYIGKNILEESVPDVQLHLFSTRENMHKTLNRRIKPEDITSAMGKDLENTHYYICGNEEFTRTFRQALAAKACENIYTDEW